MKVGIREQVYEPVEAVELPGMSFTIVGRCEIWMEGLFDFADEV